MGKKLEIEGRTFGHLKAIRNTGEKQRLKGRFNQPPLFLRLFTIPPALATAAPHPDPA